MAGEAVLVVEQEEPVRAFLEQQLTDDGFEVLSASEARRALELLEDARPDLVLLDAVLPDGSGFEVCSRLREGEPGRAWNRDVPVIMVSARSEPVDRLRGFARGCDDYLANPSVALFSVTSANKPTDGIPLASLFSLAASGMRLGATAAGWPDGC